MKITNATSKKITLVNGTVLAPKRTVMLTVTKGSELFQQIKTLEKRGSLTVTE